MGLIVLFQFRPPGFWAHLLRPARHVETPAGSMPPSSQSLAGCRNPDAEKVDLRLGDGNGDQEMLEKAWQSWEFMARTDLGIFHLLERKVKGSRVSG